MKLVNIKVIGFEELQARLQVAHESVIRTVAGLAHEIDFLAPFFHDGTNQLFTVSVNPCGIPVIHSEVESAVEESGCVGGGFLGIGAPYIVRKGTTQSEAEDGYGIPGPAQLAPVDLPLARLSHTGLGAVQANGGCPGCGGQGFQERAAITFTHGFK